MSVIKVVNYFICLSQFIKLVSFSHLSFTKYYPFGFSSLRTMISLFLCMK